MRGVRNIWLYLVFNMWAHINAVTDIALMYRDPSDLIIRPKTVLSGIGQGSKQQNKPKGQR